MYRGPGSHSPDMYGSSLWPSIVFSRDGKCIYPNDVKESMTDLVYSSHIGAHTVRFYKDGFIVIDSPSREEAVKRLNCLMLCFRLLRLGSRYVPAFKPDELCTIRKNKMFGRVPTSKKRVNKMLSQGDVVLIDPGPEFIIDKVAYTSFRSVFLMHGDWRKDWAPLVNINAEELKVIGELAEKVYMSKMRVQLLSFVEAWTLRDGMDWNTGFILSWICIESMVFNQLVAIYGGDAIYLKNNKGVFETYNDGTRKELSTYVAINRLKEGLNDGTLSFPPGDKTAIDVEYLDQIQEIRKTRNEIVHGNRRAGEQELQECFKASTKALWRLMKLGGIVDYSDYLARMDGKHSDTEVKLLNGRMRST